MLIFPHFDLNTFLWGLGKFLFWLPIFAISETPIDPSVPAPEEPTPVDPGTDGGTSGGSGSGEITVTTGSKSASPTISATSYTGSTPGAQYNFTGSYTGNSGGDTIRRRIRVYKDGVQEYSTVNGNTNASSSSWSSSTAGETDPILQCDNNTYSWRARAYNVTQNIEVNGGLLYFKSASIACYIAPPTTPTVGGGTLEATQAYIVTTVVPHTLHSTATLQFQYKRSVDSTWTNFGTSATTGGSTLITFSRIVTGLTPSTSYDVRLMVTRTTVNETLAYSTVTTFSTPASTPTITTVAATTVTSNSAALNMTVTMGNQSTVNVDWLWGLQSDLSDGSSVLYAGNPVVGPGSGAYTLVGLQEETTYYFRARVYWNSNTEYSEGSILSFTTTADPSAEAQEQEMLPIQDFDRKYGVETTLYFVVAAPAASSSNLFYTGSAVWAGAGECKISKDGGAFADTTNDPIAGGAQIYALVLTATEMQCNEAYIVLTELSGAGAGGTPVARDVLLRVRTHLQLGSIDIDAATGQKANTTAMTLTGYGSGHGLSAVSGATGQDINGVLGEMVLAKGTATAGAGSAITIGDSSITTADYFTGNIIYIIGGTGAGQARVITAYSTGKVCTVHKAWKQNPSSDSVYVIMPGPDTWEIPNTAELASIPAVTATWRELLTFLFQRFKFKRTQTATTHTMFKDDGSTSLGTATVSDSSGTQTFGELA